MENEKDIEALVDEYKKTLQDREKLSSDCKKYTAGKDTLEIYVCAIGVDHLNDKLDSIRKQLDDRGFNEHGIKIDKRKTLVYCDTTTEIGRHIIENAIWWTPEADFYSCDPKFVEFVTDGPRDPKFQRESFLGTPIGSIQGLDRLFNPSNNPRFKDYIHFAEWDAITSRKDCRLIVDLSRLNHPEGSMGILQYYVDLFKIEPHPEIICLYKTSGIYPIISDLAEGK